MRSRDSLVYQCVSSMSTIIMPMLMESAPRPRLRLVVEKTELGRQRILVLRDVEIHAARIGFVAGALFRRQVGVDAMRGIAKLKHALRLVVTKQRGAHDFGEFAIGVAAKDIHLPQAILRGDVALRDEHVLLRGGVDVGNAMLIAADGDGRGERGRALRGEMDIAVEHGKRGLGSRTKPENAEASEHHENRHQPCGGEEKNPGPAAFARTRLWRWIAAPEAGLAAWNSDMGQLQDNATRE